MTPSMTTVADPRSVRWRPMPRADAGTDSSVTAALRITKSLRVTTAHLTARGLRTRSSSHEATWGASSPPPEVAPPPRPELAHVLRLLTPRHRMVLRDRQHHP